MLAAGCQTSGSPWGEGSGSWRAPPHPVMCFSQSQDHPIPESDPQLQAQLFQWTRYSISQSLKEGLRKYWSAAPSYGRDRITGISKLHSLTLQGGAPRPREGKGLTQSQTASVVEPRLELSPPAEILLSELFTKSANLSGGGGIPYDQEQVRWELLPGTTGYPPILKHLLPPLGHTGAT